MIVNIRSASISVPLNRSNIFGNQHDHRASAGCRCDTKIETMTMQCAHTPEHAHMATKMVSYNEPSNQMCQKSPVSKGEAMIKSIDSDVPSKNL